ncbi:DUF4325 domain-containing protein [Myroides sp. JBRI-B21084]|uniref:STAS-like domain-containing protein n=1 Tax=Myroides sp. JBRI-B21084 TaxID=3119977 RepID=UPI0026E382B5|nr:DUF4325 domain-containing protein [Paenimyroides cloacae]WKW47294.1 DUF4325 domain-containing protein [Paenimyroides cloacae]
MTEQIIRVRKFSITPGSRYKDEGPHSGEEFREKFLEVEFKKALAKKVKLIVDLDGTIGYGTSWLEEVFGGLVRSGFKASDVEKYLDFISNEEPYLIEDIQEYIANAEKRKS